MSRFVFVILMAAVALGVQGFPYRENDIASAAAYGKWDEVHKLLTERLRARFGLNPLDSVQVKDLKPVEGGQVFGESNYEFHSASNVNGHKEEQSGGHRVVNDNGRISEYDYKPNVK